MKKPYALSKEKLTSSQLEILVMMFKRRDKFGTPLLSGVEERGWMRPKDLGSFRHSLHSQILANLVEKGFVERRHYSELKRRPSWMYKINEKGCEVAKLQVEDSTAEADRPVANGNRQDLMKFLAEFSI